MPHGDNKIRVFFSFHVPADIGARLLSLVDKNTVIALYPKEKLHITLKFIGEVDRSAITELSQIASAAAHETPALMFTPKRFVVADERLRLEVLPTKPLMRLFDHINWRLKKFSPANDSAVYVPHITLARVPQDFDVSALPVDFSGHGFEAREFGLYQSEQGADKMGQYTLLQPFSLGGAAEEKQTYTKIILPTRSQPDTIVAIFILKKFGENYFPGIKDAAVDFWQVVPEGETEESLDTTGVILLDLGGGRFDHHAFRGKTMASDLIARYLGVDDDPSLAKLFDYARRDDFYGKGTISADPIDRAFGLSALIAALNKSLVKNPGKVIDIVLPLLVAHHNEEVKRTKELPMEFQEKLEKGEAETFEVKQRDKKLKVVMITSESGSLAGYLRSQNGGKFDVVAQWLPSGHLNILTRPTKRVDLRSLAVLLRVEEATRAGSDMEMSTYELARPGRIKEIPQWYYDTATNSIQNGGLNPKEITPTAISREDMKKILDLGLSEKLWDPRTE